MRVRFVVPSVALVCLLLPVQRAYADPPLAGLLVDLLYRSIVMKSTTNTHRGQSARSALPSRTRTDGRTVRVEQSARLTARHLPDRLIVRRLHLFVRFEVSLVLPFEREFRSVVRRARADQRQRALQRGLELPAHVVRSIREHEPGERQHQLLPAAQRLLPGSAAGRSAGRRERRQEPGV